MTQETLGTVEKRLLSKSELMFYLGLGKNRAEEFGKQCGALRKFGRRALYDKTVIDEAIDRMG